MAIERTPQDIKQTQDFIRSQERKELWTAQEREESAYHVGRDIVAIEQLGGKVGAEDCVALWLEDKKLRTVAALIKALDLALEREHNLYLQSEIDLCPEYRRATALLDSLK